MGDAAEENPGAERALLFPHGVGGGLAGEEEQQLGVQLIPDRAMNRSNRARWPSVRFDALDRHDPRIVAVAAPAIAVLVAAVAIGAAPIAGAAAIAALVPAAVIDVEQRRLPDIWVGAALVVLVTSLFLQWAITGPIDIADPIGGALAMTVPVLALHLVSPDSMGFGDVKVAVVLGGAVGTIDWRLGAVALCIAALTAAVTGLALRRRTIPFGPFLVAGAWVALLAHGPITDALFTSGVTR